VAIPENCRTRSFRRAASPPQCAVTAFYAKLLTLRARTDHDLLVLVKRNLDRGFALLDVATTRNSPLFVQAEKAFAIATAMLPRIAGLSADDRQRIKAKVEQLRFRFDEVPAYADVRSYPASIAS
jgi:hypothetical protein